MTHPDRFLLAGVMGWPVMHSRSPKLHNYWLGAHGLAGAYVPLAIKPEGLRAALRALPALGFSGCNLTIPHKEAALAIVDRVDPLARRIGAVNTVVVAPDGSLEGQQHRRLRLYREHSRGAAGWRADSGPIVVIGAGGGARAVLVGLIDQGAREIRLVNRTLARAEALARELGGPIKALAWDSAQPRSTAPRCWSTPPIRAWWASRRSTFRSIHCRRARWSPTSSTFRARRRCWRPPASAATRR